MTNGKKVWLTLLVSLTLLVTVGTVYALRIVLRAEQTVQTMHAPIKGREATVIEEVEPQVCSFWVSQMIQSEKQTIVRTRS